MHKGLSNILMLGITPVIAHIERYDALENNEKARARADWYGMLYSG